MNEFTRQQIEARKQAVFDAMGEKGKKRILKKGYEKWDPFQEPKDPIDIRREKSRRTSQELVREFLQSRPMEGYNSARGFRDWVTAEGRVLGVSRLHPWSHWITPIVRPKRYDTRFYLAVVTEGAKCTPDREETTQGIWMTPERAIEENERGRILLSPPTLVTLHELLAYNDRVSLKGALRTRSWGRARIPRLGNLSDGVFFLLPWDPHYGQNGSEKGHTVGVPFSRLRLDGEIWHVVAKGTVED